MRSMMCAGRDIALHSAIRRDLKCVGRDRHDALSSAELCYTLCTVARRHTQRAAHGVAQ